MALGACAGTVHGDVASGDLGEEVAATSDEPAAAVGSADTGMDATRDSPTSSADRGQAGVGLLYVARAGQGTSVGVGTEVQVILTDADASVLWFQDRPGRAAGSMRMSEFVGSWAEVGFAQDPPNAVIRHSGSDEEGRPRSASGLGTVIEMSDPVWDQPSGTLRFTARPAQGEARLPESMRDVSLFIDDGASQQDAEHHSITVRFANVQPGQDLGIQLQAESSATAYFSSGPPSQGDAGVGLTTMGDSAVVTSMNLSGSEVQIHTSAAAGAAATTLVLELYIASSGSEPVGLLALCDPGVEVTAAVGSAQPTVVGRTPTLISLKP